MREGYDERRQMSERIQSPGKVPVGVRKAAGGLRFMPQRQHGRTGWNLFEHGLDGSGIFMRQPPIPPDPASAAEDREI